MCLIVFDWNPGTALPLRLVANRDEFHQRPTQSLDFWADAPDILAGRDLQAGGTWLGLSRSGRLAAITNVRETCPPPEDALSRGHLVSDFLSTSQPATAYLEQIQERAERYPGFNLLLLAEDQLWHYSNRGDAQITWLEPGTHGVSNAGLNTPWPKLIAARSALQELAVTADLESAFQVTGRREPFTDGELPETGVGLQTERLLSPPFIVSPVYGTRCSTVIQMHQQQAQVCERRFDDTGETTGQTERTLRFSSPATSCVSARKT